MHYERKRLPFFAIIGIPPGALHRIDDAFNLDAGLSEVHEETDVQLRSFETVQALSHVYFAQFLDGLQLDKKPVLHKEVGYILTNYNALIDNMNGGCCATARLALVNSYANAFSYTFSRIPHPGTLLTVCAHPITRCVNSSIPHVFAEFIPYPSRSRSEAYLFSSSICVHPRSSAVSFS